ncbi:MAG: CoA synthetase [Hyphomicrobiaceae bacterium]|nr:MAG: CoA synthetase [Hyphomicrobiaceae bacterium]
MTEILSVKELAGRIPDGACIALPSDYSGCAMAVVRELMRRPVRDLHTVSVPQAGFQVDMLIGAGCVARVEAAAVTLGEHGIAPRFTAAIKAGEIEMWDSTCPALLAGLQAGEKGVPFMPLRGIIGSDLLNVRPDWKVIDNPLAETGVRDPVVVLPAIRPDVALFHALKADRNGNVWVGVQRELMTMAHAARQALVTVERIEDTDFLSDPALAAGTLPGLYVTAIAEAPNGAWPVGLDNAYRPDGKALAAYAAAAMTAEGFTRWMREEAQEAAV